MANKLAMEVLGRTVDELLPQTRKLLVLLHGWVKDRCGRLGVPQADFRFTRRDVREALGWGDTQLKVHLGRLVELEYLVAHRGRQGRAYAYELIYAGEDADGRERMLGLIDGAGLQGMPSLVTGATFAGDGRGMVGGQSGTGRAWVDLSDLNPDKGRGTIPVSKVEKSASGVSPTPDPSYPLGRLHGQEEVR